jgi:hypothetical protein
MKKLFKISIIFILAVITIGLFNVNQRKKTNIGEKIINIIDNKCGQNNSCNFMMNEITNFKWDKMLIYDLGSSNFEISKALGVEYKDSVDLASGLVFVYDNKIIFKEKALYYLSALINCSILLGIILENRVLDFLH